jgi:uncharacterized BrkB/YihY/UPF0761 family membrane protein
MSGESPLPAPNDPPEQPDSATGERPERPSFRERADAAKRRADGARRSVETRAESLRARHASVRLAYAAFESDRRQAGALLAGGIAYRLFLWLLPTALSLVGLVGLVADLSSTSPERVAGDAGLGAALAVTVAQAATRSGSGSLYLLLLGGVLTLWAGRSVVKALRLTSAVAWRVQPSPLGRAILASVTFTAIAIGLMLLPSVLPLLHRGPFGLDVIVELVALAGLVALSLWMQSILPHPAEARWKAFVPGAIVLAIGADLLRIVTQVYFAGRLGRVDDLYGALGLAAVFMAWLYLGGRLIVASFAVSATRWRADEIESGTTEAT